MPFETSFESFLASFLLVGLAEVGDKTQIAVLALSSRYAQRSHILLGVFFAFFLVDGIAVVFGEIVLKLLPLFYVKVLSGAMFVIFGILMLVMKEKKETPSTKEKAVALTAFTLIFLSEFGDKTQIATMFLVVRFGEPFSVFAGVMGALSLISVIAVFGGRELSKRVPYPLLNRAAGILFILLGVTTWLGCLL